MTENINRAFEKSITFGQGVADRVAAFGGDFHWHFFLLLAAWIGLNSVAALFRPFDPYPYILLNLMLSCLAAMQAPIIMMSQNRIKARDRLRSENDYQVNLRPNSGSATSTKNSTCYSSTSNRNFWRYNKSRWTS